MFVTRSPGPSKAFLAALATSSEYLERNAANATPQPIPSKARPANCLSTILIENVNEKMGVLAEAVKSRACLGVSSSPSLTGIYAVLCPTILRNKLRVF